MQANESLYDSKYFRLIRDNDKEKLYRNKYSRILFSYLENYVEARIENTNVKNEKEMIEAYDLALEFIDKYFTENQLNHLVLQINKYFMTYLLEPYYISQFRTTKTTSLSKYGFIPQHFSEIDIKDLLYYYKNPEIANLNNLLYPSEEMKSLFSPPKKRAEYLIVDKYSPELLREILESEGKSQIIFWLYPDKVDNFLYKSGRPKTSLTSLGISEIRLPKNLILNNIIVSDLQLFEDNINYYIAVTRYGKGMSGIYYKKKIIADICGTFYYFEPESDYLLAVNKNKILISDNKYSAIKILNNNSVEELQELLDDIIDKVNSTIIHENDKIDDLSFKTFLLDNNIADKFMTNKNIGKYQDELLLPTGNNFRLPNGKYADYMRDFYALEDSLDQSLCRIAKDNNIDVIILTKMVGAGSEEYTEGISSTHRLVIEVLDTRDRNISYNSLFRINK